ncbi:hypothetical protein [Caldicellulosiruptor naganoensis]|uniref:Uncharacterized protein n=1 Tax=Caldicellulosiruptor naganoensis TaxID=29324 RepID=A0ABY7BGS1_9FIRM|nr:hypothetical protein [Caldicellulosiruptor naganoensis]WAM31670.1 hypothetical protein OTJ99_000101 [Caldicellulosiruptor naganoensis]
MKIFKLIKYQMIDQKFFYIIFFIVLNLVVFYFYRYGGKLTLNNNPDVENFLAGVSFSYLLATLSLLILHIVMYYNLLSKGKKYLIFGSLYASAANVYLARLINFVLDIMLTKAYLLLLLFAMSMVDEKLYGKYWWWILLFNKIMDFKTNCGIVLVDLSLVLMLSLWMHICMIFKCWNNRHGYNAVDTAVDIIALLLFLVQGFAGGGPIDIIQKVNLSTFLLNFIVIAITLIAIVLFAMTSISRMKTKMDL